MRIFYHTRLSKDQPISRYKPQQIFSHAQSLFGSNLTYIEYVNISTSVKAVITFLDVVEQRLISRSSSYRRRIIHTYVSSIMIGNQTALHLPLSHIK